MIPGHSCNYYCRGGEHCEQVRCSPSATRDHIWQALAGAHRLWVTDAIPAPEPMSWTRAALLFGVRAEEATQPWLIWWREDYDAARADYDAGAIPRFRSHVDG